ncbi:tail fiber assembly protein [Providencia rettgeri]|nr:tail fiber assembly protein [Providencia rettgeri]
MDESIDIDSHDDVKLLVQNVDDKNAKYQESLILFEKTESEYQAVKSEYDGILPIFFDIQVHLNSLTKMSKKEVDAYINPPVSKEQLIAEAEQQKQSLLTEANSAIAPLQDAVDLDMATDEEVALLKEWRKYRVLLNRVDTSLAPDIDWPQKP